MVESGIDRFGLAKAIIGGWWPPIQEEDGYANAEIAEAEARLGIQLPESMAQWYRFAGRRKEFIGSQDHLVALDELRLVDENLLFCVENQGVMRWGIASGTLTVADPPVLVELIDYPEEIDPELVAQEIITEYHRAQWVQAAPSFSSFMQAMIAEATLLHAQYAGDGDCSIDVIRDIEKHYRELMVLGSSRLLGDANSLIHVSSLERSNQHFVMTAFRKRLALERMLGLAGESLTDCLEIRHSGHWWSHDFTEHCRDVYPLHIVNGLSRPGPSEPYYPPCHDKDYGMTVLPRDYSEV